ncbi:MAG: hypothetical protein ACLS89_00655 [Collinsella sp.]
MQETHQPVRFDKGLKVSLPHFGQSQRLRVKSVFRRLNLHRAHRLAERIGDSLGTVPGVLLEIADFFNRP